ncbi:E3 ubiquitin-protein ligase trim23 [Linnemannia gamsii]|uniref:E3 ubiquitin-protein ligase trim23 n=1 Tax=Linnemannia gamsii TaxID=64522 RepID=A0ABQ7JLI1_9FUNG|nr:E3 ubiquitin-protein ligase trim23 [Linnemannia gamsii]
MDHLSSSRGRVITTKSIICNSSHDDIYLSFQDDVLFKVAIYGGNPSMMWNHNTAGTAGVVCVVDSADEIKIEQTGVALSGFYERHEKLLRKSVLLVLANKQDRLGALSVAEVKGRLELETRFKGRRWHIQGCDVVSGEGLQEGVDWMNTAAGSYVANPRVYSHDSQGGAVEEYECDGWVAKVYGARPTVAFTRWILGQKRQVLVIGYEGSGVRTFLSQNINHGKMKAILDTNRDDDSYLLPGDTGPYYLVRFEVTVCGGNPCMYWCGLPEGTAGVICIFDSSDEKWIELTMAALLQLCKRHEKALRKSVLLVLANKQDPLNALSVMEETNAVSGDGVQHGMDWMSKHV